MMCPSSQRKEGSISTETSMSSPTERPATDPWPRRAPVITVCLSQPLIPHSNTSNPHLCANNSRL
ncbi:hypothetical protein OSTOST_24503 [Ostertagia ostertagi]